MTSPPSTTTARADPTDPAGPARISLPPRQARLVGRALSAFFEALPIPVCLNLVSQVEVLAEMLAETPRASTRRRRRSRTHARRRSLESRAQDGAVGRPERQTPRGRRTHAGPTRRRAERGGRAIEPSDRTRGRGREVEDEDGRRRAHGRASGRETSGSGAARVARISNARTRRRRGARDCENNGAPRGGVERDARRRRGGRRRALLDGGRTDVGVGAGIEEPSSVSVRAVVSGARAAAAPRGSPWRTC